MPDNLLQWRRIVGLYRAVAQYHPGHEPMLELVRWLADSDSAAWLAPQTSHLYLTLRATGIYGDGPKSRVQISHGAGFALQYHGRDPDGSQWELRRDYAPDEIKPALEAWLWRLRIEAASENSAR